MTLRPGLITASLLVVALAVLSLTDDRGAARTVRLTSSPRPALTRANRKPARRRPRRTAKPALAPATVMTSPSQEAIPSAGSPSSSASFAQMVGQQMMVRMTGTVPDSGLIQRIRDGQVGGVIIYSENIVSQTQLTNLISQLQAAASAGDNPPLLISTDQEGGQIKRLPWAAPTLSAMTMGAHGAAVAQAQGQMTGTALRAVGINVDLAPVADIAHSPSAFIWQQQRSFGMTAATVTSTAAAFAQGLQTAGVAATAKHFPGLGSALVDTDTAQQTLTLLPEDLTPYRRLISEQIPLIMVSTAVYSNEDPANPAALSGLIIGDLLRGELGYQGVVITDDLDRPTGLTTTQAVLRADQAGADILLVSTSEQDGAAAYQTLLAAAENGQLSSSTLTAAYQRIRTLKQQYAG